MILNVAAAASLSAAFEEIAASFSAVHPRVSVSLSFVGSATLATQIVEGSPVDVVAMADISNMEKVTKSGDVVASSVRTFATNRLAVLVAEGNPLGVSSLADLTRPGIRVVLCDPSQPCGRYADEMLSAAGLSLRPSSLETSAAGVVTRVRTGEADAGISYFSDALAASGASFVEIPDAQNVVARYPIGVASHPSTGDPEVARMFVDFVVSSAGRSILERAGFGAP